jgi:hypothetical protein
MNEEEDATDLNEVTDICTVSGKAIGSVNYKLIFLTFLFGLVIFSDLFVKEVLVGFEKSVFVGEPTTKGTVIQLLFLCLAMMVMDLLIVFEWI